MIKGMTLHPQLLAAVVIVALVLGLHARGYGDAEPVSEAFSEPHLPLLTTSLLARRTIVPKRDPFVSDVDEEPPAPRPSPPIPVPLGEGAAPTTSAQRLQLRAVVLGARRYALVADGSSSRIVTVGTALAGSVVTDISLRGIALANGARFVPEEGEK